MLELCECSKLSDIGLQVGSESTRLWQFTWTDYGQSFHERRSGAGAGLTKVSRKAGHVPYVCLELIRIMWVQGFPQFFEDMGLEILPLVY